MLNYLRIFLVLVPFLVMAEDVPYLEPLHTEDPALQEQTNRFMYEFIKMLVWLGALIGVLLLINWYVKKLGGQRMIKNNEFNLIKVIETRTLSPRSNIYLLEIAGQSLVIGETPQGLVRLSDNWKS